MSYTGLEFIFSQLAFKNLTNPQKEWEIYKKFTLKRLNGRDHDLKEKLNKLQLTISWVEENEINDERDLRNLIYKIDFNITNFEKNSSSYPCPVLNFFCEFLRINNPLNRNGLSPYYLIIKCYGEYNDQWADIVTFFDEGKYMYTSTKGDKIFFQNKLLDLPFYNS